jgi:hypothetical protein
MECGFVPGPVLWGEEGNFVFHRISCLPRAWQAHVCRVMTYAGVGNRVTRTHPPWHEYLGWSGPERRTGSRDVGVDGDTIKARATQVLLGVKSGCLFAINRV